MSRGMQWSRRAGQRRRELRVAIESSQRMLQAVSHTSQIYEIMPALTLFKVRLLAFLYTLLLKTLA